MFILHDKPELISRRPDLWALAIEHLNPTRSFQCALKNAESYCSNFFDLSWEDGPDTLFQSTKWNPGTTSEAKHTFYILSLAIFSRPRALLVKML